jgi:uncharacterized caspase-like protein/formylglycine-generating enzyme required for sulfatase activity
MSPSRLALLTLSLLCSALSWGAETRIALVIGNSSYTAGSLPNPANDARMIGDTLKGLGFEVIPRTNADQTTMKRAIQEFGERLEKAGPAAVGLFYYAGHGVQLNGKNYLIPTTAHIEREGDVEIEAVSADWVIEQMRYARNRLNIMILDACRNNPFIHNSRGIGGNGLATIEAPAGILIAYSTAPGSVATDGSGRDSPYAEALSHAMRDVHEPVEQVFKHVRVGVMDATSGNQVPWESSSLTGDFYFAAAQNGAAKPAASEPTPAARVASSDPSNEPTRSSGGISGWFAGLFSSDKPASDAPAKPVPPQAKPAPAPTSAAAPAAPAAAPQTAPATTVAMAAASISGARALPVFKSLGITVDDIAADSSYPPASIRSVIERNPRHVTLGNAPQQMQAAFAMCQKYSATACRVSDFSDEILREATLEPFDIDALPVSVAAFRRFVEATHYRTEAETAGFAYAGSTTPQKIAGGNWRNGIMQRAAGDDSAVIGVTFQDAVSYCHWKNQRLPTENEWEYVARGPERHTFPWGESVSPALAYIKIQPHVGDGPAQGIGGRYRGLSGNVWQWVDSRFEKYRILKGGSWLDPNPANKRAAARLYQPPNQADDDSGFRCARSIAAWPDTDTWMAQLK